MTSLALMGLLPANAQRTARHVNFIGEDLKQVDERRLNGMRGDRMAMIFQEPMTALNPAYTVGEQLMEGIRHHRSDVTKAQAWDRAVSLLETCGIGQARQRMGQYPHQMSGGLRQRVMIAMALMTEPDLLIADEPTTALDATIQAQILDLLKSLQKRFSLGIILITHNLAVVQRVADKVVVMYAGEVVEAGPAQAVLAQPSHPYTKALLACIPDGSPRHAGHKLGYLPGTVPSLIGIQKGCQFRDRCALAREACAAEVPWQEVSGPSHRIRCAFDAAALSRMQVAVVKDEHRPENVPASPMTGAGGGSIEIRGLEKRYALSKGFLGPKSTLQALRGVDLSVVAGQALGIVGESGCGKSTLAKIMLGLEAPSAGTVMLDGRPLSQYPRLDRARLIQPIFQDPYSSLNPRRTVADTVRLPLDIHAMGNPADRERAVKRMMNLCGLPARVADVLPSQLSGGQRQRVAIASALVMNPKIVVCDEPTSALDVSVQAQILNLLHELKQELGLTLVVISHDLHVIRYLADRVAVMYLGRVVEERATEDLIAAPAHPYTRMLLAAEGFRDMGGAVVGEFPNPLQPPSGCAFHPRCRHAQASCAQQEPPDLAMGDGRVACLYPMAVVKGSGHA
jgi:peptide/nickel transport system ATP-binding protein